MAKTNIAARALQRGIFGSVARSHGYLSRGLSYHALSLSRTSRNSRLVPFQPHRQQQRPMVVITKTSSSDQPLLKNPGSQQSADTEDILFDNTQTADSLLTVTPSCIQQVRQLLKRRNKTPDEMFLRVFVDAGGCSGFTYQFELDDDFMENEDMVFGAEGVRVVVDEASLKLIQGSKIDYVQEMIKSAFVVNPQSESACGCGSSFAVKNFASNPALD